MIQLNFKPCCQTCTELDLYDNTSCLWGGEMTTIIGCGHQKVCEEYKKSEDAKYYFKRVMNSRYGRSAEKLPSAMLKTGQKIQVTIYRGKSYMEATALHEWNKSAIHNDPAPLYGSDFSIKITYSRMYTEPDPLAFNNEEFYRVEMEGVLI